MFPIYKSTVSRQKAFLSNTIVEQMDSVIGLDYPLKEFCRLTLHQVIMAMVRKDKKSKLFVFVDQHRGNSINIAYQKEQEEETQEFIEGIPIILSKYLNLRTWSFFDKEIEKKLMGYKWSSEYRLCNPEEEKMFGNLNQFTKNESLQEISNEDFF